MSLLFGLLAATGLSAQDRPSLSDRLSREALDSLSPILAAAARDSIPVRALENKALEGAAKQVNPARIIQGIRQLAIELRNARAILQSAATTVPGDAEIIAAADAGRRGVPPEEIIHLRRQTPAAAPLVVSLTVLGDLVQRGIPAGYGRVVIQRLAEAAIPIDQIAAIPGRVDVGLHLGASPVDALRGAVPRSVPLGLPPSAPARGPENRPGQPGRGAGKR